MCNYSKRAIICSSLPISYSLSFNLASFSQKLEERAASFHNIPVRNVKLPAVPWIRYALIAPGILQQQGNLPSLMPGSLTVKFIIMPLNPL